MKSKIIGGFVLATLALGSGSCASVQPPTATTQLPVELHGIWEAGVATCVYPGNPDSDSRIVVTDRKIEGYEDWTEILEVKELSDSPRAWRVAARLHVYEETSDISGILALSGEDDGQLTIINGRQSNRYERCL